MERPRRRLTAGRRRMKHPVLLKGVKRAGRRSHLQNHLSREFSKPANRELPAYRSPLVERVAFNKTLLSIDWIFFSLKNEGRSVKVPPRCHSKISASSSTPCGTLASFWSWIAPSLRSWRLRRRCRRVRQCPVPHSYSRITGPHSRWWVVSTTACQSTDSAGDY